MRSILQVIVSFQVRLRREQALRHSQPLPNDLTETIRQVHAGRKPIPPEVATRIAEHLSDDPLTEREVEVLQLAMAGSRNRDIANRLFISEETVKAHIKHILEKLGASDRTQAVTIAVQLGIIQI